MQFVSGIEEMARLADAPVRPACAVFVVEQLLLSNTYTEKTLIVPAGELFIATHAQLVCYPYSQSDTPQMDKRSENGYAELLQIFATQQGKQLEGGTAGYQLRMGEIFHVHSQGKTVYSFRIPTTAQLSAGFKLYVWLKLTGFLAPMDAQNKLNPYHMKTLTVN